MHERALNDKGFTCIDSNTAGRFAIIKMLILCCSQHLFSASERFLATPQRELAPSPYQIHPDALWRME